MWYWNEFVTFIRSESFQWFFTRAYVSASSAAIWLASQKLTCKAALWNAYETCWGQEEPLLKLTPGFGPPDLAWGWALLSLLTGLFVGVTLTLLTLLALGRLRQPTTARTLANLAQEGGEAQEQAQQEVLRYIAAGGREALRELAQAAGTSEVEFLLRLLRLGPPGLVRPRA